MRHRPARAGVAVLALAALSVALGTGTAEAQEGEATISVEQVHPGSTSVHYVVELTDVDGEPVGGATVTAVPTLADGTQGTPATLTPASEEGVYQGAVELSAQGEWTVTFTSSTPEASLAYDQEMPAQASSGASEDEGSGSTAILLVVGIVVVVLLVFGVWALLSRSRPAATPSSDQTPTDGPLT